MQTVIVDIIMGKVRNRGSAFMIEYRTTLDDVTPSDFKGFLQDGKSLLVRNNTIQYLKIAALLSWRMIK